MSRRTGYFGELYRSKDGWRWRVRAGNNRIVAESAEAYNRQGDCKRLFRRLFRFMRLKVLTDKGD